MNMVAPKLKKDQRGRMRTQARDARANIVADWRSIVNLVTSMPRASDVAAIVNYLDRGTMGPRADATIKWMKEFADARSALVTKPQPETESDDQTQ